MNNHEYFKQQLIKELEEYLNDNNIAPTGKVLIYKRYIAHINDLRMDMHVGDHNPSHFHVTSTQAEINARFSLDGKYINNVKGAYPIPTKNIRKIEDFFQKKGLENIVRIMREELN